MSTNQEGKISTTCEPTQTDQRPKEKQSEVSVNVFEGRKFDWWADTGPMRGLKNMNELRIPFVRDTLLDGKTPESDEKPLRGFTIIDVGCGGGLMCEPLAELGAQVTGIDVSKESIDSAEEHFKSKSPSLEANLKYIHSSVEDFISTSEIPQFDAAIASEVAEHVDDLESFIKSCAKLVKPDGYFFITTINRTFAAYLRYILLDEKILRVLPSGTHPYKMLIPPARLKQILQENGFTVQSVRGMMSSPWNKKWKWMPTTAVNYFLLAKKSLPKPVENENEPAKEAD